MSTASAFKDEKEIEHFAQDANKWWDLDGPFAPLHKLNPVRLRFITDQIKAHFDVDALEGVTLLDVGCGGGLVCEPLARLGGDVTGIDLEEGAIEVAKQHASDQSMNIDYRAQTVESLENKFDVVLALEIAEHVVDPAGFIKACAQRLKPGGLLIVSAPNRTARSFMEAIVAAEYILRWVPRGTHDWRKFIKPSEMAEYVRDAGLLPTNMTGVSYHPILDRFALSDTALHTNYLLSASDKVR